MQDTIGKNGAKSLQIPLSCYSCGPIDAVTDEDAVGWRVELTEKMKELGIVVFDPTKKDIDKLNEIGIEREYMNMLKKQNKWHEFYRRMEAIVHEDLKSVDRANFLVAYLPIDVYVCGTLWEIMVARSQKKKIYAFYDYKENYTECQKHKMNSWLLWAIGPDFVFKTLDDVMNYVKTQTVREIIYKDKL